MFCKQCGTTLDPFDLIDGSGAISIQVRVIKNDKAELFCRSSCARAYLLEDLPDDFWEG